MGHADLQPIWLTDQDEAPNGAQYLFLLDGMDSARLADFARVFDLFDGRDEAAVEAARERYKQRRAAAHALTYWQQTPKGWEKK
jgi:DNA polymerase-3 subunit chi